ncbi:MAG: ISNCY family transposase [Dehalococcoidia bacterium]
MEEGTLRMSLKEHYRSRVCQKLLEGRMSEVQAAQRLRLSTRQVRRIKKRVALQGPAGAIHRLRGTVSNRATPPAVEHKVADLYQAVYAGWNITHFTEHLERTHGIGLSREKVRRILIDHPDRPRRHKRRKHRRWRKRRQSEGELVQMDASTHNWLGDDGEEAVLINAIDDATGQAPWAQFFEHDGTIENLTVVKRIVQKHGIFASVYLDRSNKYFPLDKTMLEAAQRGEEVLTQFGRVMHQLGIEMIKARSPQAKGRVERSFNTFQDRLIKELALEGIKTREAANQYLWHTFLPDFNRRFGVKAVNNETAYVKMIKPFDYNAIFCLKDTRTVQNDYTISYKGHKIQLEDLRLRAGVKVEVRIWLDRSLHVYWKAEPVKARQVGKHAV